MKSYWSESFEDYADSVPQLPESRPAMWPSGDADLPGIPMARIWSVSRFARGYVPSNYEPRYAYPLIVWLTGPDCSQHKALSHVAQMSPQNYVGLAVDGCVLPTASAATGADFVTSLAAIEDRIVAAVQGLRRTTSVHPDRVFLAGVGSAATAALLVALHHAEWFAGAISFGGEYPLAAQLLAHRREVLGRRFWLTAPRSRMEWPDSGRVPVAARELIALGADVTTHLDETDQTVSRDMLRTLDEWILQSILGPGQAVQ